MKRYGDRTDRAAHLRMREQWDATQDICWYILDQGTANIDPRGDDAIPSRPKMLIDMLIYEGIIKEPF